MTFLFELKSDLKDLISYMDGINNSTAELGFNTLGASVEIRTTAGVAEATQVNPVVLV